MKKLFFAFLGLCFSATAFAQIEGKWKTIDDETGKAKSIIEIFKKNDGKYYGKINQLLIKPESPNCDKCKDDRKNKPILGMEVLRNLVKDDDAYTGTITNPKDGKTYKTSVSREGNTLKVKAIVLGIPVRTQTWHLVK